MKNVIASITNIHYAWIVCLGCGLLLFCNAGLAMGGFSVYLPYIVDSGGFTNMQGSLLMTIRSLAAVCGTTGALFIINRIGLRKTAFAAGILSFLSFLIHSLAHSYLTYCVAIVLSGASYGIGSILLTGMVISRWFNKHRALAMGIAVSFTGIAVTVAAPVVTALIGSFGLHLTFRAEAIFIIIANVLAAALIRNDLQDMGLNIYGSSACAEARKITDQNSQQSSRPQETQDSRNKNSGSLLTRKEHALMVLAVFLIGVGEPAYSQLSMLLHTSGYRESAVSMILSFGGIMLIIGKLSYSRITDTIGSFKANCLVYASMILGMILLLFAGLNSFILMIAAMMFFGMSISLHTVGLTTLATDTANAADFPAMLKTFQIVFMCGSLAYSIAPGMIADLTSSYLPSYMISIAVTAASLFIVMTIYTRIGKGLDRKVKKNGKNANRANLLF